jgi:hypothetical protein
VRDLKTQFRLLFKSLGNVDNEFLQSIKEKREACKAEILTPYSPAKERTPEEVAVASKKKKY